MKPVILPCVLLASACATKPVMPILYEAATQQRVSKLDFATTEARFRAAVDAPGGPEILAVIDHGANAAEAGLELSPSKLFLIGNPEAGTPLMQAEPPMGMELPLHFLIFEAEGEVKVAYPLMQAIGRDYSVIEQDARLQAMEEAVDAILTQTTGSRG